MRRVIIIYSLLLAFFIPAGNEPGSRTCADIWRMPQGSNTHQLAAGYLTCGTTAEARDIEQEKAGSELSGDAAGRTMQDMQQPAEETDNGMDNNSMQPVMLTIDNRNVYEGMKKAYKKGYTPTVEKEKVILVVPLVAEGELKGNVLTASVDLGATEQSPFRYKNYEKTFSLEEKKINGTDEKRSVYYIRFDLSLAKSRYNGIYPVTVSVAAKDLKGNEVAEQFTIYITITDGKAANDADMSGAEGSDGAGESTASSEPVVLVKGCLLEPVMVNAGGEVTATVTLENTNTQKAVQNMVVTVEYESENFTFLGSSETIYVPKLDKGGSTDIPLHFRTNRNMTEGNYKIMLTMNYDNSDAVSLSSAGSITIPVKQEMEVELTVPQISKSVTAGDTLLLDFQVLNLGRSKVYNVRCDIEGEGLVEINTAFVGNLEGGMEGNASMNLFIDVKNQEEKYGKTDGVITMAYEDAGGKEYTQEFPFTTTIEKPIISSGGSKKEEEKPAGQWWISIIVVALLAAGAGGIMQIRRVGQCVQQE